MLTRHHQQARTASPARQIVGSIAAAALLAISSGAQAQITFNFDYSLNTPGVGFLDGTNGPARVAALTKAGMLYSDLFSSHFSNSATLDFRVTSVENAGPTLASAGSFLFGPTPGFGPVEITRNKLVSNGLTDLNGAGFDGNVDVNFGYVWELDPNTPAIGAGLPGQSFDFYAAMFHEFTHALGFANTINFDGMDVFGTGVGSAGSWGKYDQFLVGAAGNRLIDDPSYMTNGVDWAAAREAGVFFDGPNAVAANFGNKVDLYAPNAWLNGSSVGHLNTDNPAFLLSMMKHNRDYGPQEARIWSNIEVGIMTDLGYTVAVIPEPSTWLLMVAGFAGVVARVRRRQTDQPAVASA